MIDKRRTTRSGMIKGAQIAFADVLLNCAVFDLSSTGARIHLLAPAEVPEMVILRLPDGTARAARRRWQRDAEIGFEFLAASAA